MNPKPGKEKPNQIAAQGEHRSEAIGETKNK
jgi:hypothetical protein